MKAYSLANRFLTVLPWPGVPEEPEVGDLPAAVARFPFVGLALGLILIVFDFLFGLIFPIPVRSVILIIALIILTGGIHLKALAGWMETMGPAIFKGSWFGSLGTVFLAGLFLLKFAAFLALPERGRWSALLLAPVIGRASLAYLLGCLPKDKNGSPVEREEENVAPFFRLVSKDDSYVAVGWAFALSLFLGWLGGIIVAVVVGLATYEVRRYTRDGQACVGAAELMETLAFLLFAAWWGT